MKLRSSKYDDNIKQESSEELCAVNAKKQTCIAKYRQKFISIANDFTFIFFRVIGYIPSHIIRKLFYKYIFHMTLGKNVVIYYGLEARSPWRIKIGRGTIVGDNAIMDARFGITIGENVNISTGAWMWTQQHDFNSKSFSCNGKGAGITIGDRAWISSRTTILPGVCVGTGSVIAAGAVVTRKSIDPFSVWGGVPAKKICDRTKDIDYEFNGKHRFFL